MYSEKYTKLWKSGKEKYFNMLSPDDEKFYLEWCVQIFLPFTLHVYSIQTTYTYYIVTFCRIICQISYTLIGILNRTRFYQFMISYDTPYLIFTGKLRGVSVCGGVGGGGGTVEEIDSVHDNVETFFASLVLCEVNSLVTGEFPSQRPMPWSFDVFFDLHLNKRLSKQSRWQRFESPLCSLWRQYNAQHNTYTSCRITYLL